jgi:hypothetical protein
VHTVREVDVGEAGSQKEGAVAHVRTSISVAGRIVCTQVSLRLDDDSRGEALSVLVSEDAPEEIHGDLPRIPVVEGAP